MHIRSNKSSSTAIKLQSLIIVTISFCTLGKVVKAEENITTSETPGPGENQEDENVCLLFSRKNFTQGGSDNSPLLSLRPTVKIFETNLLFHEDPSQSSSKSEIPKGIVIQSVNVTKANCSVILCDGKHLEGSCIQLTKSSADISGEDGVAAAVYKNVRSVDCHCSFLDPDDIVALPPRNPVPSEKLQNSEEIEGYPLHPVFIRSKLTSCATLFRDWHYKGKSLSLEFAGSAAKIESDLGSRIRSAFVKDGCTVTLWNGKKSFSLFNETSFRQTNESEQYDWVCCYCDECSQSVCENAQRSSQFLLSSSSTSSIEDFSLFVNQSKKIIGIGRNYRWTKVELAKTLSVPKEPIVFLKPSTSFIKEGELIKLPKSLGTVFYELELGVVIGKKGKYIPENQALDHVAGYFLALDMTAKEFIKRSGNQSLPWEVGKGFDTACPVGDFIPKSQLPDPNSVQLECKLNGEVTQKDNTGNMIFNVEQLIAYISRYMTLEPYDVILTGTPDGFGPMKEGDVIDGRMGNLTSIHFVATTVPK